jgi:hypothetical protein
MKQLLTFLSNIQQDKLLHFLYGALISFPLIFFFNITGFIISAIIFAAKEIIHDKILKRGNPEVMDFLYSLAPAILFLIMELIKI